MPTLLDLPNEILRRALELAHKGLDINFCFNSTQLLPCLCKESDPFGITRDVIEDPYRDLRLVCRQFRTIVESVEEPIRLTFPKSGCMKSIEHLGSLVKAHRIGSVQVPFTFGFKSTAESHLGRTSAESYTEYWKTRMSHYLPPTAAFDWVWIVCAQNGQFDIPDTTKLMLM